MPAKSKAQFRWLHTKAAQKALGKKGVKEWIGATDSKSLPERVSESKPEPRRLRHSTAPR